MNTPNLPSKDLNHLLGVYSCAVRLIEEAMRVRYEAERYIEELVAVADTAVAATLQRLVENGYGDVAHVSDEALPQKKDAPSREEIHRMVLEIMRAAQKDQVVRLRPSDLSEMDGNGAHVFVDAVLLRDARG